MGEDGNGRTGMEGRYNRWRVGGKDGGGVGTTKAAAIAVIRHGGGAR